MRSLLTLLLMLFAASAYAANDDIVLPAGWEQRLDTTVPALARQALARYDAPDAQQRLGTVFRLQLAAGRYADAITSIQALRRLRNDPPNQPPLFLQYEIHARARQAQAEHRQAFAQAWPQAFAARFAELDDRSAQQAGVAFSGYLPRMRQDLDQRIEQARGKRSLPLDQAIELVRAWQVHDSYAAFQPLFAAAPAADDARRYQVERDLLIATPDGARVSALLVLPRHAATPLPVLLTFTVYANDDWAWDDARKMAAHGYASVVAYSRGKGRSPDAIVPFEHDGGDAAAVIDWIAAQRWSDGRVGMYGGSYSGFTQWAALKQRPAALKAIATSATTAPGIDVPMEGGVFLNFMYAWPFYTASNRSLDDASYGDSARWQRLDQQAYRGGGRYRDRPAIDGTANPVFSRWLQHPRYDAWWRAMIPQGSAFADIDIPVLATTGYFDGAQIGVLHYFRNHLQHRPNADHTLLIGPYEHFTMQTGLPPVLQGYTPDPGARIDLQAMRLAWFDHVFKGAPKPTPLAGRVNWQVMGADTWRHADTLEAMATRSQRYYLHAGANAAHRLDAAPSNGPPAIQRVDFSDRSDADWQPSPNVLNPALDPHAGLVFRSDVLTHDLELAGPFSADLYFTLNKADADLSIGIYAQGPAGQYFDLAYALQRLSQADDRSQRHLLQPGQRSHVRIQDTRLLGSRLPAGSRIVVTVGVLKQPNLQLNLGSGKEPADETLADAGEPLVIQWHGDSHVTLPIRD